MIQSERENVQGMLLKCIIQVSTKIPLYSVLVGRSHPVFFFLALIRTSGVPRY